MPVLTFVNGRKQYVLQRVSTQEIIKRGAQYPTAEDGGAIAGLDPDLRYLEMWRDVRPDEDPRVWIVSTAEAVEEVESLLVFHMTYVTTRRSSNDIKNAAKNVESAKNQEHIATSELLKLSVIGQGILFKRLANQTLTVPEEAVRTRIVEAASALRGNDARLTAIIEAVEAGDDVDLDSGWQPAPTAPL
ncbi:MAG: hypothetical protein ACAI34_25295 [Verrucomicrobium sp.]